MKSFVKKSKSNSLDKSREEQKKYSGRSENLKKIKINTKPKAQKNTRRFGRGGRP